MTVLGLKLARRVNAVSSLHGEVSRAMWRGLYPDRSEDAVPIGHVTNGVHVPSWLAPQIAPLYDRPSWRGLQRQSGARKPGRRSRRWTTASCGRRHLSLKDSFSSFVRRRAREQAERRAEPAEDLKRLDKVLSPDALTIGFARRFATYKRAPAAEGSRTAGRDGQRRQAPGQFVLPERRTRMTSRARGCCSRCADDAPH